MPSDVDYQSRWFEPRDGMEIAIYAFAAMCDLEDKGFAIIVGTLDALDAGSMIIDVPAGRAVIHSRATRQDFLENNSAADCLQHHAPFYYEIRLVRTRSSTEPIPKSPAKPKEV